MNLKLAQSLLTHPVRSMLCAVKDNQSFWVALRVFLITRVMAGATALLSFSALPGSKRTLETAGYIKSSYADWVELLFGAWERFTHGQEAKMGHLRGSGKSAGRDPQYWKWHHAASLLGVHQA